MASNTWYVYYFHKISSTFIEKSNNQKANKMSINIELEHTFLTPVQVHSKCKPPTLTLTLSSNHSTASLNQSPHG